MSLVYRIVKQHAEEAAFLWLLRDASVRDSHYNLQDIAKLDDRIEAHIDGLRIAGDDGWEICKQALEIEEPGEVFTAAVLALESGNTERIETIIAASVVSEETRRGLVSAFGWLPLKQINTLLSRLLKSEKVGYKRLRIAVNAIHRQDPGVALVEAFDDQETQYQARSIRAVGELKRHDLLSILRNKLSSEDPACRFWAAWSALLLGDRVALDVLKTFATPESPFLEQALHIMLRAMDTGTATKWLDDFMRKTEVLRYAVLSAGIIGDPRYIPWLINAMNVPEVARVAGEAFSMTSGIDLAYDDLEGDWPEGFEAGPTEDPADEDVAMDRDENLPWPEPTLIQNWWEKNKHYFQAGTRYLVGKPVSVNHCQNVLRTGFQRQRRAAALELALLQRDEPLFNTSAPGFRQQKMLL